MHEIRKQFLTQLESGVKEFGELQAVGADLSRLNLSGVELLDAALCGASLGYSSFERSVFDGADLSEAQIQNVIFQGCRFHETNLMETDCSETRFENCDFQQTLFHGASLVLASFGGGRLRNVRFTTGTLLNVSVLGMELDECVFEGSSAQGLSVVGSLVCRTYFMSVNMSGGSLAGSEIEGGGLISSDFTDVDFRGTDLSRTKLTDEDEDESNNFKGAKYNSSTKFPEGFDAEAEGMIRVADFTVEEEAEIMWKEPATDDGHEVDDDEGIERSTMPVVEGLFIPEDGREALGADIESLAARVNGATWPPSGYEGAEKDAKLALSIQKMLQPANEGSSIDSDYYAFVLAPEAEMPGEEDAINARVDSTLGEAASLLGVSVESFETDEEQGEEEYDDEAGDLAGVSSRCVFLHSDAQELVKTSKTWWREYYGKEEFKAREAASELMFKNLSDVDMDRIPYGRAWNHAIYSGMSKTGAQVGVMAVRFDEEDD